MVTAMEVIVTAPVISRPMPRTDRPPRDIIRAAGFDQGSLHGVTME